MTSSIWILRPVLTGSLGQSLLSFTVGFVRLMRRPVCMPIPVDQGTYFCSRPPLSVIWVPGWHLKKYGPFYPDQAWLVCCWEKKIISDGIFLIFCFFLFINDLCSVWPYDRLTYTEHVTKMLGTKSLCRAQGDPRTWDRRACKEILLMLMRLRSLMISLYSHIRVQIKYNDDKQFIQTLK